MVEKVWRTCYSFEDFRQDAIDFLLQKCERAEAHDRPMSYFEGVTMLQPQPCEGRRCSLNSDKIVPSVSGA